MKNVLQAKTDNDQNDSWMSISDIMTALMMIFLFISISYMSDVKKEKDKIKQIAATYKSLKENIYMELQNEFKNDFNKWNAEMPANSLTIAFRDYFAQFDQGDDKMKIKFKRILQDFFPRYMKIIKKYYKDIEEIRIEGHTSSEWRNNVSKKVAYLNNMRLSQGRTRSVLSYLLTLTSVDNYRNKLLSKLTATGLSSSHLIFNKDGTENKKISRRVEFVIRTNAETRIEKILN